LAGLLIRTHRFGRLRAQTDDDRRWAARVIDALDVALRTARGERLDAFDKEVHDEPEF
jgi:hypothetical protein